MLRNADYVDFAMDQLDVKKKMKAKLGPEVILRLRFGPTPPSPPPAAVPDPIPSAAAAIAEEEMSSGMSIGTRGYELVARQHEI